MQKHYCKHNIRTYKHELVFLLSASSRMYLQHYLIKKQFYSVHKLYTFVDRITSRTHYIFYIVKLDFIDNGGEISADVHWLPQHKNVFRENGILLLATIISGNKYAGEHWFLIVMQRVEIMVAAWTSQSVFSRRFLSWFMRCGRIKRAWKHSRWS